MSPSRHVPVTSRHVPVPVTVPKKSLKLKTLLSKVVRYTLRDASATATANAAAAAAAAAAATAAALLGEAKPSYVYTTQFRVSSPLQSRSQAVVCVSTPRKYPRSGYFLVT